MNKASRAIIICTEWDFVQVDIPPIVGMEVMYKEGFTLFLISNSLDKRRKLQRIDGKEVLWMIGTVLAQNVTNLKRKLDLKLYYIFQLS